MKINTIAYTKETEAQVNDGVLPSSIIYNGPSAISLDELLQLSFTIGQWNEGFDKAGIKTSYVGDVNMLVYTTPSKKIHLSGAELQSKYSRVKWAEDLIIQLPKGHEGRDSWLLNYGVSEETKAIRRNWEKERNKKLVYDFRTETYDRRTHYTDTISAFMPKRIDFD